MAKPFIRKNFKVSSFLADGQEAILNNVDTYLHYVVLLQTKIVFNSVLCLHS